MHWIFSYTLIIEGIIWAKMNAVGESTMNVCVNYLGENWRKFDLIRTGKLIEYMKVGD